MKTFKKILVAGLAAMSVSSASAQIFVPIIIPSFKKNKGMISSYNALGVGSDGSYSNNMIAWKSHKLSWKDFKGKNVYKDGLIYHISYANIPFIQKKKIGNTTYTYFENKSFLDTEESWVDDSHKNPETLKLAETDFNLWELYARKALIEYNSIPDASIDEIYNFYKKLFARRKEDLRQITENGTNREKLDEYSAAVEKELEDLPFNPEAQVAGLREKNGYYISLGISSHIPFTKYISTGYGLNMSAGGFAGRHMIGADLDLEFGGKCCKDIWTEKGTIYEGDKIFTGGITLQYGYTVMQKSAVDITPYFGFGVHFYDGGEVLPAYQKGKKAQSIEKSGVSFGIGCAFDIIASRGIAIKTEDSNIRKNVHSLGIKPYFSLTHYSGDMGWVPALNIAVDWDMRSWKLK